MIWTQTQPPARFIALVRRRMYSNEPRSSKVRARQFALAYDDLHGARRYLGRLGVLFYRSIIRYGLRHERPDPSTGELDVPQDCQLSELAPLLAQWREACVEAEQTILAVQDGDYLPTLRELARRRWPLIQQARRLTR